MTGQQPAEGEAKILQFPVIERTCFECVHASVGMQGTHCLLFSEMIISERLAARDCESYEVVP